jgi:predicted secreted Zn-dependent protease
MNRRRLALFGVVLASMATRPGIAGAQVVRVVIDTTYYRFEGRAPSGWRQSEEVAALAAGLKPPVTAKTNLEAVWVPGPLLVTTTGCAAGAPDVEIRIRYTMPQLVPASGTSEDALREWRRYLESVWRHEDGHATRAIRAGVEIRDSLNWLRTPTCGQLRGRLQSAVNAVWAKYSALHAAYDGRTRDGYARGIWLPHTKFLIDTTFRDTVP